MMHASATGRQAHEGPADILCWTRMQAEAGQALEQIVARKEIERDAGDGLFLWGIGTAPAHAIRPLAIMQSRVPVVFSRMKGKPRAVDVAPARTVLWRAYYDRHGALRPLPRAALVTSKGDAASGPKRTHYALMCHSEAPLRIGQGRGFDHHAFRNAGGAGAPVGASQVTALLRRTAPCGDQPAYEANMEACLTESYWVRLADPVPLDEADRAVLADLAGCSRREWLDLVGHLRRRRAVPAANARAQPLLV